MNPVWRSKQHFPVLNNCSSARLPAVPRLRTTQHLGSTNPTVIIDHVVHEEYCLRFEGNFTGRAPRKNHQEGREVRPGGRRCSLSRRRSPASSTSGRLQHLSTVSCAYVYQFDRYPVRSQRRSDTPIDWHAWRRRANKREHACSMPPLCIQSSGDCADLTRWGPDRATASFSDAIAKPSSKLGANEPFLHAFFTNHGRWSERV